MSGFANPFSSNWVPSRSTHNYTISNYCTNLTMVDTSRIDLRTSKRKRAQVNYYEAPVSDDEEIGSSDEEEQNSCIKKRKTSSSKRHPPQKPFPFLELPGELRNRIYIYCLHDPAGIFLRPTTKHGRRTVARETECRYLGLPEQSISNDESEDSDNQNDTDDEDDRESTPDAPDAEEASKSTAHGATDGDNNSKRRPLSTVAQTLTPALLAVCKQINTEARGILYDHKFHVTNALTLHSFLIDLGPRGAVHLKNIELAEWQWGRRLRPYNHACFTALSYATNLEKFSYLNHRSYSDDPTDRALSFYRDAYPWLEAVGVAKGKADAGVDMVEIVSRDATSWPYSQDGRYWAPKYTPYKWLAGFRKELARLLNARMERIKS